MGRLFPVIVLILLLSASPARAQAVTGAGSTFAFPLLGQWGQRFQAMEAGGIPADMSPDIPIASTDGLGSSLSPWAGGIDYEPVGSLGGTMRVISRAVDFGASERPLPAEEVDRHGLVQFPMTTGGIAVVFNLPNLADAGLRLTGAVLADIYLGKVNTWSDPALKALNPDLPLPDAPIDVVHRSDGSGTTFNFAAYLAQASGDWSERVGVDTELKWPVGRGVEGNRGIAGAVAAGSGSIGYVEAGQARRGGLSMALIENHAGEFREPSPQAIAAAAAGADYAGARHFEILLVGTADPGAYPIAATVYALMPRERGSGTARTLRFFDAALTRWRRDAIDLGYVPLPDEVVGQIKSYWETSLK